MPLIGGGTALLGSTIGGVFNYYANREQQKAAQRALKQQQEAAQQGKDEAWQAAGMGANAIHDMGVESLQTQQDFGQLAADEIGIGRDQAVQSLTDLTGGAADWLSEGFGLGAQTLGAAGRQAREDVLGATGQARQDVLGAGGRLSSLLSDPTGYMAQDPGYQFRQQQGEDAINRAAAARGGRLSSRTLQELGNFNQGLASQEFGQASERARLADLMDIGQAQAGAGYGVQGGITAAQMGLGVGTQQAGLQQGLGAAEASLYGGLGTQLAGLFTGSSNNLASLYGGLGTNLGNTTMGIGQGMAGMYGGYGANQAGITGSMLPQFGGPTGYAGAGTAGIGQSIGGMAQNIGLLAMIGGAGGGGSNANPGGTSRGGRWGFELSGKDFPTASGF